MYIYVNEEKLTEAEWNEVHANDVDGDYCDNGEYWHMNSYAEYSKDFDEQMASQVKTRDWLRKEYVRLMKAPFNDDWALAISDFNEAFKDCYGRSSWFFKDMLNAKGVTYKDVTDAWDRDYEKRFGKKEA